MPLDSSLDQEDYCYLTTIGRRTGEPHTIEIWFTLIDGILYMLSGGRERSDWVRNINHHPHVQVRIGKRRWQGIAHIAEDRQHDARIRSAVAGKYRARGNGDLDDWERDALPVGVVVEHELHELKEV